MKKMARKSTEPLTLEEEIKCLRACLERILRCLDESKFVDYQMEKFGRIVKEK